ncbi:MAG: hypothetical protein JNL28_13815 [Planctomycetes bacterium]|nr:hypothetical protein [Planctomycetota bacterium]
MQTPKVHRSLRSTLRTILCGASLVVFGAPTWAGIVSSVRLSEIDVHKVGIDTQEFIELQGTPGASLNQHMLLFVDGDSVNAGVLDRAIDLSGFVIPPSGFFVLGDTALVPKNYDLGAYDQLENGTTTYFLVTTTQPATFAAMVGTRITVAPDVTVIGNFATVVDSVAIADADYPTLDIVFDGAPVVGSDGVFMPAGIARCANAPNGWSARFNDYDPNFPTALAATPGAANPNCDPGVGFCFGDGSGTACPCGNNSAVGAKEGCQSSLGFGARLHATGVASLSNDTMQLVGTQMPDAPVLYFQGTNQLLNGAGAFFGDGLFCAGGSIIRLGLKFNLGGTSTFPGLGDPAISVQGVIAAPGVRTYQGWYRNAAVFCTPSTFNLTHGLQVQWVP